MVRRLGGGSEGKSAIAAYTEGVLVAVEARTGEGPPLLVVVLELAAKAGPEELLWRVGVEALVGVDGRVGNDRVGVEGRVTTGGEDLRTGDDGLDAGVKVLLRGVEGLEPVLSRLSPVRDGLPDDTDVLAGPSTDTGDGVSEDAALPDPSSRGENLPPGVTSFEELSSVGVGLTAIRGSLLG